MQWQYPLKNEPPFVADFASTTAANGKLGNSTKKKRKCSSRAGSRTKKGTLPLIHRNLKKVAHCFHLGSDREHGSHKGYCLGSIVDIFSAVLSGASYGPWAPPFVSFLPVADDMPGKGLGHFFGVMRVDAFQSPENFKKNMDQWIRRFRSATPVEGMESVLVPGDPEREMEIREEKKWNSTP